MNRKPLLGRRTLIRDPYQLILRINHATKQAKKEQCNIVTLATWKRGRNEGLGLDSVNSVHNENKELLDEKAIRDQLGESDNKMMSANTTKIRRIDVGKWE